MKRVCHLLLIPLLFVRTSETSTCSFDTVQEIRLKHQNSTAPFEISCIALPSARYALELCPTSGNLEFYVNDGDWTNNCTKLTMNGTKVVSGSVRLEYPGTTCLLSYFRVNSTRHSVIRRNLIVVQEWSKSKPRPCEDRFFVFVISITTFMGLCNGLCIEFKSLMGHLKACFEEFRSKDNWKPKALFSIQPWKVCLFGQLVIMPALSGVLSAAFPEPNPCNRIEQLCRVSLFLLGTSPPLPWAPWFVDCFGGNVNQTFAYVLVIYTLSPLTMLFWWGVVGVVIDPDLAELKVPVIALIVHFSFMVSPSLVGMILRCKFPNLAIAVKDYLCGFFVIGIHIALSLQNFCDQTGFERCLDRQLTLCFVLGFAGSFFSCTLALAFGISKESSISIAVVVGAQNCLFTYPLLIKFAPLVQPGFVTDVTATQNIALNLPICLIYLCFKARRVVRGETTLKSLCQLDALRNLNCCRSERQTGQKRRSGSRKKLLVLGQGLQCVDVRKQGQLWQSHHELEQLWHQGQCKKQVVADV